MAKNNVKAAPEAMEQQVTKTEAFFEKNKKAIIICVVAIIAIVVLAILAKNYYFEPRANEASTELAKSQDLFLRSSTTRLWQVSRRLLPTTAQQMQAIWLSSTSVSARLTSASGRRLSTPWRVSAARTTR